MNGAQAIARHLSDLGVRHVFGLPGTQNGALYCELLAVGIATVPAMHELGAGFQALGYAATSDQPAVLAIIGGPGASYAATPLLEARLDSIPLVCLVFTFLAPAGRKFGTQQFDHTTLGATTCKQVFVPEADEAVMPAIEQAWERSRQDEPGPVMVLIDADFLSRSTAGVREERATNPSEFTLATLAPVIGGVGRVTIDAAICPLSPTQREGEGAGTNAPGCVPEPVLQDLLDRLQRPAPPVFFAGRGALAAGRELQLLAERFSAPVITTTSARGVIPECHPLSLRIDRTPTGLVNEFLATCDLVIAWGVKFSQNGGKGYRLALSPDKLIHVDSCQAVLGANYPTPMAFKADVPRLLQLLLQRTESWERERIAGRTDLQAWRIRLSQSPSSAELPIIRGVQPSNPIGFFRELRALLADDTILVLDSGYHQSLARVLFPVHAPHSLLLPTGLQSMGFSLPAALGAALAAPERRVVALLGDGGLRMCGMELQSAVMARIPLVAIVFDDGYFGLIRQHQVSTVGTDAAVQLPPLDYEAWSLSMGVQYFDGSDDPIGAIRRSLQIRSPSLVRVLLLDSVMTRARQFKARLRRGITRLETRRRSFWRRWMQGP